MFELVNLQEQDQREILSFLAHNEAKGDKRSVAILLRILADRVACEVDGTSRTLGVVQGGER